MHQIRDQDSRLRHSATANKLEGRCRSIVEQYMAALQPSEAAASAYAMWSLYCVFCAAHDLNLLFPITTLRVALFALSQAGTNPIGIEAAIELLDALRRECSPVWFPTSGMDFRLRNAPVIADIIAKLSSPSSFVPVLLAPLLRPFLMTSLTFRSPL